ncbi:MAG: hypothetical protein M3Q64_02080 [bacterium]|nr:hypothetical protein [bacterium]
MDTYSESVLNDQDVRAMIEYRNIQPEDYSIIVSLSRFPKAALFTNFSNLFQQMKTKSAPFLEASIQEISRALESDIHNDGLREVKEMQEWYLEICRKYDWATADNINKVLGRLQ